MGPRFTFIDGSLRYDCVTCGARCCKGLGIGLDNRMARELVARRPAMGSLLRAAGGGELVAQNPTDGCWFLTGEGLCDLERESGRAAKPVACRLFPFNRIFRVGAQTVVDVNSYLCPVQEASDGSGVRHGELEAELEELGERVPVGVVRPPQGLDPEAALATEGRVLEHCTAAWRNGVDRYLEVARLFDGAGGAHGSSDALVVLQALVAECLGTEATVASSGELTRRLVLLTPSLRFNALFRGQGGGASPGSVTRMLIAFEVLLRAVAPLAPAGLSLRTITELWQSRVRALRTLARLDQPPGAVGVVAFETNAPPELQGTYFKLAGMASTNPGGQTLGDLLAQVAPDPVQRILLLPYVASLAG